MLEERASPLTAPPTGNDTANSKARTERPRRRWVDRDEMAERGSPNSSIRADHRLESSDP